MKRIIRLTEKDLTKIVKRILKEDNDPSAPEMPEIPPQEYLDLIASVDTEKEMGSDVVTQQITEYWNKSNNLSRLVRRVIRENEDDVLTKYLRSKPELIPLYQEIERVLEDKFTEKHFIDEIKYSGGLKELSGGLLPKTITAYKSLKKKFPSIDYSDRSYRNYELQKDVFLEVAEKRGKTISGALTQAALPGFSQHHTGKSLDLANYSQLTPDILKKYNFSLPYPTKTSFRMAEPWHVYLVD